MRWKVSTVAAQVHQHPGQLSNDEAAIKLLNSHPSRVLDHADIQAMVSCARSKQPDGSQAQAGEGPLTVFSGKGLFITAIWC
jgi:hypothetical protein